MIKRLFLLVLAVIFVTGCAFKQEIKEAKESSYFGIMPGTYAKVYYKADEAQLELSIENTTTAPMRNLVVVVRQATAAGVDEIQRSFRMLRMHSLQELTVPLAEGGTGEVGVDYYFVPAPLDRSDEAQSVDQQFVSDFVRFKVKR